MCGDTQQQRPGLLGARTRDEVVEELRELGIGDGCCPAEAAPVVGQFFNQGLALRVEGCRPGETVQHLYEQVFDSPRG